MTRKQFPDAGLYLDDLTATGKPSLGDLHTVSWIVRHYAKDVLDKRAAWHAGEPGADNPISAIQEEATHLAAIFQGKDERFDAQPWNAPARIGNLFRVLLPQETKDFGDPMVGAFMWIASQTVQMTEAIESGVPEATIKPQIDAMLDDITARLLGIKY